MSVSKWAYEPKKCDGDYCPGDCDNCPKRESIYRGRGKMKVNKIIKSTVEEELEITGATLLSIEEVEKYLTESEREYSDFWWVRSPSCNSYCAQSVVDRHCVRPALQISNLKSSNFKIGDTFEIGDYKFKVISDNLAWMYKQDIGHYAFNEDFKNGNDYETSDVKKFVDKWFKLLMFNNSEEK